MAVIKKRQVTVNKYDIGKKLFMSFRSRGEYRIVFVYTSHISLDVPPVSGCHKEKGSYSVGRKKYDKSQQLYISFRSRTVYHAVVWAPYIKMNGWLFMLVEREKTRDGAGRNRYMVFLYI